MSKNFDDLYDDFFNKSGDSNDLGGDEPNPLIKSVLDSMINSIRDKNNNDDDVDEGSTKNPTPDKNKYNKIDGDSYTKESWETEDGTFSKITIKDGHIPDDMNPEDFIGNILSSMGLDFGDGESNELTLEDKLQLAVDNEEYEKAADIKKQIAIRDENV